MYLKRIPYFYDVWPLIKNQSIQTVLFNQHCYSLHRSSISILVLFLAPPFTRFLLYIYSQRSFFAITGPPEAPLITNITVNGIRCILQWKKPYNGESPIQMYSVSVWILLSANNGSNYKDRLGSWNTNGTNFTLDVEWNHNYTTSVSAWNKHGQSVSSAERQFKTGRFPQGIKNSSRWLNVICLFVFRLFLFCCFPTSDQQVYQLTATVKRTTTSAGHLILEYETVDEIPSS